MQATTLTTLPFSYRKPVYPLRAAKRSAGRTGTRGKCLINFAIDNAGLLALVFKHSLEAGPSGIKHRFGHFGFRQFGGRNVADVNFAAPVNQLATEFMKCVCAFIPNFSVNRLSPFLSAGTLGFSKLLFLLSIPASVEPGSVRAGGNRFQSKVDADSILSDGGLFIDRNNRTEVPATTCVLGKTAGAELHFWSKAVAVPHFEPVTSEEDLTGFVFCGSCFERNPSERTLSAKRFAPAQFGFLRGASLTGELLRNFLNGRATDVAKLFRRANRVLGKVKTGHPFAALSNHAMRKIIAIIPHRVDFSRHHKQQFRVLISDSELDGLGVIHTEILPQDQRFLSCINAEVSTLKYP